jgi:hypothetical protein
MGQAKRRGTKEERVKQAMDRPDDVFSLGENLFPEEEGLLQFFGYSTLASPGESPFDLDVPGMVCMISNIAPCNLKPIRDETGIAFNLGDWFVSVGAHDAITVHGPFPDEEECFEFARANCGAVRFKAAPVFEMF